MSPRLFLRLLPALAAGATLLAAIPALANRPIWQIGVPNGSSAEFADYPTNPVTTTRVGSEPITPAAGVPKGLKGDRDPVLDIRYSLKSLPRDGALFTFKLLNAPASGSEMAVFSNRIMAGLVQLWGTAGTPSPYRWQRTYQLYIPKELLQVGENSLRLETSRPLWSDASVDNRIWCEWDYLNLGALDQPAREPIHGAFDYLGTTLKQDQFFVNDDTLKLARVLLPWMGIAYSGNSMRADFWYDVPTQQPRRKEYLELLRDLNMSVVVDYLGGGHFHNDPDGQMPARIKADLGAFLQQYGSLIQYYETGNEPCMFGGGLAETINLATELNRIKPAHMRVVAPGWAYGGGKGTPKNWDADVENRRQVEKLCQATNGHSYGYSYADARGGSFIENLQTFGGVRDGWPKEYINTETGANNWHSEENGPRLPSSQPHAQAFDRILRAHLAVVHRTMQHAVIFPEFGMIEQPKQFTDLSGLAVAPGVGTEDPAFQTYRRLALAYATHGAPLSYAYLNRAEVADHNVYFRAVDTSKLSPLQGSGATANRILLSFVNFESEPRHMRVRVTLPARGEYRGDRFGPGRTYAAAHSTARVMAAPTAEFDVTLPARDSVEYILSPVRTPGR